MSVTPHLALTLVESAQAQKEVTVNQALTRIDALLNTGAKSRNTSTPPGSPATGDVYIVGAGPTGAWLAQAGNIAYFDQVWRFIVPISGMTLWVSDEYQPYTYHNGAWNPGLYARINAQTGTAYTLVAADLGKHIECTNAAAITLTLPNSLPQGFQCRVVQTGTGQVTLSPASGATLSNVDGFTKTAARHAWLELYVSSNVGGSAAAYRMQGRGA